MSIEGIRFHHQIKQVRSAFARTERLPADQLVTTYQLSFAFLKQLLIVDLLSVSNSVYCKGDRWTAEPDMSLDRFLAIARSSSVEDVPEQLKKPLTKLLPDQLDKPVTTYTLGQVVKPRQNLAMNLKFIKSNHWNGVLSWYSSRSNKVVDSISLDSRQQDYQQEVLEVNGKIYRVVDLEEHVEKALVDFFDGSVKLTIQRRTKKHRA